MSKLLAVLGILLGSAATFLGVAVAFGLHITPDQHTALLSVVGVLTAILGLWFHPDVPGGAAK